MFNFQTCAHGTFSNLYLLHHQSVLSKGRSFTASKETKAAVLPKAGVPPQNQKPRLQFYQGWLGAVVSCCFPHSTLSFASERVLKDLKRSHGHNVEVRREDLANWALRTSPKFTTGVNNLYIKLNLNMNISLTIKTVESKFCILSIFTFERL